MLNIKEAGQYNNFLTLLLNKVKSYSTSKDYVYRKTENHLRTTGNPEAKDEVVVEEKDKTLPIKVNDLVYLANAIISEKLKLSMAIEKGKSEMCIDWIEEGVVLSYDTAISYNKNLRELYTSSLATLKGVKTSVTKTSNNAYKINGEGNQVSYRYDLEIKQEVDFDKAVVDGLAKKILKKTNDISTLIDEASVKRVISFVPAFDMLESIDDIIEAYGVAHSK